MKKILFSMLVAATMVGCSQDDVVEISNGKAIGFDSFVDNSTRATDATAANLTSFDVWGYVNGTSGIAFNGNNVTKENNAWGYTNTQYWTSNMYYFHAVAPADVISNFKATQDENSTTANVGTTENPVNVTTNAVKNVSFDYTPADGKDATIDLLYDYQEEVGKVDRQSSETVNLAFQHILSRIIFTFNNKDGNSTSKMTVTGIELTAYTSGSATISSTSDADKATVAWTTTANKKSVAFTPTTANNKNTTENFAVNASGTTEPMYFVPIVTAGDDQTEYEATFKVTLTQGGDENGNNAVTIFKDKVFTAKFKLDMEAGYSYNIVADLSNTVFEMNEIVFNVTSVDTWTDGTNPTVTVQ